MSLLPAEDVGYLELVGETFLTVRGRGVSLSPVDVELVRTYEAAGIPAPVLIRGIVRAAERRRAAAKPPPRSLHTIRRTLDAEVRRFQAGKVALGPTPSPEVLDRLLGAARESTDPEARAAYRAAYRAACAGQELSEAAAFGWYGGLPRGTQRVVARAVTAALGSRLASEPRPEYRLRLRRALVSEALSRAHLVL